MSKSRPVTASDLTFQIVSYERELFAELTGPQFPFSPFTLHVIDRQEYSTMKTEILYRIDRMLKDKAVRQKQKAPRGYNSEETEVGDFTSVMAHQLEEHFGNLHPSTLVTDEQLQHFRSELADALDYMAVQ